MKNNDEQTERYKREIQEATEELERLENEEGNDATSECVCTYLYFELHTVGNLI